MNNLHIECEHLVSIPTGLRMHTNVIFKPTPETREAIREAHRLGDYLTVSIKDASGDSTSKRLNVVIGIVDERGTIVATMKEI